MSAPVGGTAVGAGRGSSVLVVGTVPPPGGEAAAVLGRLAAAMAASGDDVEVCSPDFRSAAHRQARLSGPLLAVRLVLFSKRHRRLVLRIEPGLPLRAEAGRLERTASLLALGAALARFDEVTLRLDSPVPIPGGLGGRATTALWSNASTIVVANEADRESLLAAEGVDASRVVVEAAEATDRPAEREAWALPEGATREQILTVVRERAAADRSLNGARQILEAVPARPVVAEGRRPPVSFAGFLAVGASRLRRLASRALGRLGAND